MSGHGQSILIWSVCLLTSFLAGIRLLVIYLTKFSSKPWKPKDRPNSPAELSDPKYGVHKFATVNGIRLHYVEAGDRSKPLMLFVHGFPEFWYCWRHQITEFSKDYWTVAIDLRGYNLSEKPSGAQNYTLQTIVDDLRALIEHLNRKKVILIAHDWGAIIGWQFVSQHMHMIHKYAMISAPSLRISKILFNASNEQLKRSSYMMFFQMPILPELTISVNDLAILDKMLKADSNEYFTDEDLEAYKYVFSQSGALTAGFNYYRANLRALLNGVSSDGLDGTDGMYLLGEHDKYVAKATLELTAQEYPNVRVVSVPGANHFPHENNPKATNDVLRSFLGTSAQDCPVDSLN